MMRGSRSAALWLVAVGSVGAAAIATTLVMTERRVLFLIVPIGAFIGWSTPRLTSDRRTGLALACAAAVVACAIAADFLAAAWGFVRLGVPARSVFGNPTGIVRFLAENVWGPTDVALVFGGGLVAALLSWPTAGAPLATSSPGSPTA